MPRASSISFRPFATRYRHAFAGLVLALYREDPPGHRMTADKIRDTIRELARRPAKGGITLMFDGDTVIGYAIVVYFWSNEYGGDIACLDELYVRPEWRSRGVGARYIRWLANETGRTFKGVKLETTPRNERARRFYARCGFRPVRNIHLLRPA